MSLLPFVSCLKSTIINNVALFTNIEVNKKYFRPLNTKEIHRGKLT
jgi:hypothetical protein